MIENTLKSHLSLLQDGPHCIVLPTWTGPGTMPQPQDSVLPDGLQLEMGQLLSFSALPDMSFSTAPGYDATVPLMDAGPHCDLVSGLLEGCGSPSPALEVSWFSPMGRAWGGLSICLIVMAPVPGI